MRCPYKFPHSNQCSVMPNNITPSDKHIKEFCHTDKHVDCEPSKLYKLKEKQNTEKVVFS